MAHFRKYIAILTSLLTLQATIGMVVNHHHCNTKDEHKIAIFDTAECDHHKEIVQQLPSCCDRHSHDACKAEDIPVDNTLNYTKTDCCIDYTKYYSSDIVSVSLENVKNLLNRIDFVLHDLSYQFNPFADVLSKHTIDDHRSESPHVFLIKSILKSSQRDFSSDSDSHPLAF